MNQSEIPDELVERLRGVRSLGVITGAGISAESGIETYRGKGGIYDDPEWGDATIEALSAPTILRDPDRTWRTVAELALRSSSAKPNPAHLELAELESHIERVVVLTQNVDGLHRLAGSTNIIDIHGDAFDVCCMNCEYRGRIDVPQMQACLKRSPTCESCGGTLRPDVVLFGEMLPRDKLLKIEQEFFAHPPEAYISIGTSAMFGYIQRPMYFAAQRGILTIDINIEANEMTSVVDYALQGKAGTLVPALANAMRS